MNKHFYALIGAILLTVVSQQSMADGCAVHFLDGKAPVITKAALLERTHGLCYSEYALLHSGITKTPLWSAERLTDDRIKRAREISRKGEFFEEAGLPENDRAEFRDYRGSGWSRGHMSPSADFSSLRSQQESFSLANVIPQNTENNENLWAGIESSVRNLAVKDGELFVITGPIFISGGLKRANDQVLIPTKLFKLVYDTKYRKAAVYIVDNTDTWDYKVVSVPELEQMTGIDFLPSLSIAEKSELLTLPTPKVPYKQRKKLDRESFSGYGFYKLAKAFN
jgi:endonuclease G